MSRPTVPAASLDRPLPIVRWRWLSTLGVGLSLLVVLAAAFVGWREHRLRQEQAATGAMLVAEGVERQLQDRLQVLAQELEQIALLDAGVSAPGQRLLVPGTHRRVVTEPIRVSEDGSATAEEGTARAMPVLPARQLDGIPAGLQLLAPQPAARRLHVVWDGTPAVRVAAQVDPEWFVQPLQGRSMEVGTVAGLVHDSRRSYASSSAGREAIGHLLTSTLFAPENIGRPQGLFEAPGALDGKSKRFVYRRVAGTPLTVVVGSPQVGIGVPVWRPLALTMVLGLLLAALWTWLLRAYARANAGQARLLGRLSEAGSRLQQAQAMASMGTWRWYLGSESVAWSDEIYRIYGHPPDHAPTMEAALAYIHPDDASRMRALFDSLASAESMAETEFRIVRSDGSVRWIQAHAESDEDARGPFLRGVQQDITELAEARDRLRQTERQYRFLFEANPLPMCVFHRQTLKFLAVNEALLRQYGYSEEDLLQATVLDLYPLSDRSAVEAEAFKERAERVQGRIWTHLRKDGTPIRAAIFTHDIDFNGQPARLAAAQDVTEREAEAQRFQLIARATNDAVWDLDLLTENVWWGDSFYATFGYSREDMEPTLQAWEVLVHPDDRERVSASLAAAVASPDAEEWEEYYRLRHAGGHYRQVQDRGFVLRDPEGTAVRMLGGIRDVTGEREADERLRLLSRAMDATINGVVIADARQPDYPLVYANAAFERMTGYAQSEILGRNCRFLQGADADQVGLEGIRYALREKGEARVLLRNYRKDGTLFWNELFMGPVFDDQGQVSHYIGAQNDVSEHQHYQQELAYRATHDPLTGLPNRQLIKDRLQIAVLSAEARKRGVAVLFIDLDDFKLVNDSLDHSAGDEALRVVAARLRGLVLGSNLLGRLGGDEFVMVVPDYVDEQQVQELIGRMVRVMAEPIEVGGFQHVITMSLGWCVYPEAGYDAETLLKHADIAMYEAKRQGRNRAVRYGLDLDAKVSQRLQLIAQLREALEQQQFVLAFQPIYDRDGSVKAMECLARWQHPVRGLLPPSEFIQVCEESGLITELGRRTLHEAARHHALLAEAGHGHVRLAVNVSALQFGHDLEQDVADVMQRFALPEGVLELELTESVIVENADSAIDTMRRIKAMGVCLAIDDFGTGYSSLAYLKRLPIDRLKIDRSFVMDLPGDQDAAAVCGSVIALAHSLGVKTVGEGVETDAQRSWLKAHGCDEMQGYLMARPAPFAEILATLDEVRASTQG